MKFKQGLAALALASASFLPACDSESNYLTGTVKKEYGIILNLVPSTGAIFGNDSIRFGTEKYGLKVETQDGTYTMSVEPCQNRGLEELSIAIEEGMKIRFRSKNDYFYGLPNFRSDKIGRIRADQIEVLGKDK